MKTENKQMNLKIKNTVINLKYSLLNILNKYKIKDIDELNYQMFIRFVIIRYLEANNILSDNKLFIIRESNINNLIEMFCKKCHDGKKLFPFLFKELNNEYIEYIFSGPVIEVINKFVFDLPDEFFINNIEIVGWMHQAYVGENRTIFRQEKQLNKKHVPTLSQVFTPKWIVKYMVDNSLGKIYLENFQSNMTLKYYLGKLDNNYTYVINKIEDISIIEPCVGTGHILVYIYELLYKMYLERGYEKKEISKLIFENNIVGLDIDSKAVQIARFVLMLKASELDEKYFQHITYPRIYEIKDSKEVFSQKELINILEDNLSKKALNIIKYIKESFKNGKVLGSLMKLNRLEYLEVLNEIEKIENYRDIQNKNNLIELLKVCDCLTRKYDIMITNPPYLGVATLGNEVKSYAIKHYPNSRNDMFAMFMETDFVKENGYMAMINMHTWMFISSYKDLRLKFIKEKTLINMVHTGAYTFEGLSDTALATTFVYQNRASELQKSLFIRLAEIYSFEDKKNEFFNKSNYYYLDVNNFLKVPGYPYIYFVNEKIMNLFKYGRKIKETFPLKQGLATGDNETFVRYWHEVDYNDIKFDSESIEDAINSGYKWFPYNKGGNFRKWYGMNEYVISFDKDSYNKLLNQGNKLPSRQYYFKKGITWSLFGFENFGVRYKDKGFLFDVSGSSMFPDDKYLYYTLAFLCSNVAFKLLSYLAPTVNFQVGNIGDLPIIIDESKIDIIDKYANKCIELCKKHWDYKEVSWDYKKNIICDLYNQEKDKDYKLEDLFKLCKEKINKDYYMLKDYEEKINRIFISIYDLEGIIDDKVIDRDMSIKLFDHEKEIKNLLSYLIKLILKDNSNKLVFSLTNGELINKVKELIKTLFGEKNYNDNIDYLNSSLNITNSFQDISLKLDKYLLNNFYNDHLKMYQKRPIYIMFVSGKKGVFKAITRYHSFSYSTIKEVKKMVDSEIIRYSKLKHIDKEMIKELLDYKLKLNKISKDLKFDLNDGIKVNLTKIKDIIYPFDK